jgi:hypothetical protein
LVDGFDDAFIADGSSVENTAYIDSQNSELLPLTTIFNIESIFDRSDAATNNNIHQDKTLLLPYEEFTIVSQLSASEPRVIRSIPAPIEASSPAQSSGVVTYYPVEAPVYVALPPTPPVGTPNTPTPTPTPTPPPPPAPAMVRVITDGAVTYHEANFVATFYENNKAWVQSW